MAVSLRLLEDKTIFRPQGADDSKSKPVRDFLAQYVKREQVEPIMQACEKLFGKAIEDLKILSGGRGTSKILQFMAQGKHYLLRVTDETRPAFFIDTVSEIQNMMTVNDLNVAPKLLHSNAKSGVIIMDYIHNVRLTPQMLETESESQKIYTELARSLRHLHEGPKFTNQPFNIFRNLEQLSCEAGLSRVPPMAREVLQTIYPFEAVLEPHLVSAPCHLDIHSNNVLYNGDRIYLIDWELSSNCDPYVDLAFASMFFAFDKEKETKFLHEYFSGPPTAMQNAKFYLLKQVTLCLYAFRLLRRVAGIGKVDLSQEKRELSSLPNYRDFILENYNGCSKSFNTDELKLFPYMFLRELITNLQSRRLAESVAILTQKID